MDTPSGGALMFGGLRTRLLGMFRLLPDPIAGARTDDAHLRSSRANEARLNAAIAELDAGRGTAADLAELRGRLREVRAR